MLYYYIITLAKSQSLIMSCWGHLESIKAKAAQKIITTVTFMLSR